MLAEEEFIQFMAYGTIPWHVVWVTYTKYIGEVKMADINIARLVKPSGNNFCI